MRAYLFMPLLALTGCSGHGASQLQPGRWETTMRIVRMDVPDAPPSMRARINQPITGMACITPEQAAHPMQSMMRQTQGRDCSRSDFVMANGRITGSIDCPGMQASFNGTFTATTYDLTVQASDNRDGRVSQMETRSTARRVGECNGTEEIGGAAEDRAPPPAPAPGANGGGK